MRLVCAHHKQIPSISGHHKQIPSISGHHKQIPSISGHLVHTLNTVRWLLFFVIVICHIKVWLVALNVISLWESHLQVHIDWQLGMSAAAPQQ